MLLTVAASTAAAFNLTDTDCCYAANFPIIAATTTKAAPAAPAAAATPATAAATAELFKEWKSSHITTSRFYILLLYIFLVNLHSFLYRANIFFRLERVSPIKLYIDSPTLLLFLKTVFWSAFA
uniref:Uncharacterized protein n=1 Tax=Methanosarcina barkeri (strain Fusaro / DSM 804) TaxID=269797 RepID=Q465G6_METBF